MTLLFLEFIGTSELLVIAVVALIVFGPRKLPELGRSLGRTLGEFKRASEDFKRAWEREVEMERIEREMRIEEGAHAALGSTSLQPAAQADGYGTVVEPAYTTDEAELTVARTEPAHAAAPAPEEAAPEPARKQDWL